MSKDSLNLLYKREELKDEVLKHFEADFIDVGEYGDEYFSYMDGNDYHRIDYVNDKFIFDRNYDAGGIELNLSQVVDILVRELEKNPNHIWY